MTSRTCWVHVGLPKTGTSYLQRSFRQSGGELAGQGLDLLLPEGYDALFLSLDLRDLLSRELDPPHAFSAIDRLAEAARLAQGDRALLSQEMLGGALSARIPRLLDALDGYDVHVVVTVRDLAGFLPSAWQQAVKSRATITFKDFLEEFVTGRTQHRRAVDIDYVLDTWGAHVPPDRTHIVTVPGPGAGRRVLLDRFSEVLGVETTGVGETVERRNASLGAAQAELLRRVNEALGDRLPHRRAGYREQGKNFMARQVLLPQSGDRARIPRSRASWCVEESERIIARISGSGYHVVGTLEDLRPTDHAFADDEGEVSDGALVDAAVRALADVLVDRAEREHDRQRLRGELRRRTVASPSADAVSGARWRTPVARLLGRTRASAASDELTS